MAKRKKIVLSELDKDIIRECKKNRIFSRVDQTDINSLTDDEMFDMIISVINNLTDGVILYICDKVYTDGDINLLLHVEDTKVIIVNNDNVYQRLKTHTFNNKLDLKFYDRG